MIPQKFLSVVSTTAALFATPFAAATCSSSIAHPKVPQGKVLDLTAASVTNYQSGDSTLSFCNVTVTYTHPGWNDTIHVTVWLPLSNWNERLQGSGGGGYAMRSDDDTLAEAVGLNYAVVATDGGHTPVSPNSESWSLDASGNVNMPLLKDFAYVALNDAAIIGKNVTNSFYGHGPRYSYWNGCSTGGRQGLMLAQRYPTAYNGIMAAAPAINWPSFIVAEYWPQFVMNQLNTYPSACVLDSITNATIKACDEIDGVKDGVISAPDLCQFDPLTTVGQKVDCNGSSVSITKNDALVIKKTWEGLRSTNGSFLWYGLDKGAPLSGLAGTTCSSPSNCTGSPFSISADWISRFILQDPSVDLTRLSHEDLIKIFTELKICYSSIIGIDNPDLSAFKQAGGKMITWHGLADQLIFPNGTMQYYNRVEDKDSSVRDFYRFFEAPGVEHCRGGNGYVPVDPLDSVVSWVEEGTAPETIAAATTDGAKHRNLCPYPLVSVYKGGDEKEASSYECRKSYS
ncbi:hypothetical protein ASPWEDRAFT_34312 [Aspergillus wentii DTO 134E9]|uniref:Carboxylic ester hydrolase n=1 Tax=Aspergillus wentii DTO 134E9 TaxID=1073089 RepID=A0A1L9S139_ASPWE|nr:uncharacterized protein ASPWEDRAFT_34312 [Aspergillus wentii DTO 134E9]KAI9931158.1 hypothetical protein MW887_010816 [Aspergillus wentii]OJJ40838.1 hypothetical protein ASPWEDRAFT_34312 [Aspergillus wentii DTO 134E9]